MEQLTEHEDKLLRQMITESGEMWLERLDRSKLNSEVIVCERPNRAFYLTRTGNVEDNINGWGVQLQPLNMNDAREFFAAFGSHYAYWIGLGMQDNNFRVRAYIKNGRKSEWTVSLETVNA